MSRHEFPNGFCRSLVALEYYDGPMSGVGFLPDGSAIYFQAVAWDEEQWHRVYAAASVPVSIAAAVRDAFSKIEELREPIWCPGRGSDVSAQVLVDKSIADVMSAANSAQRWWVIGSHNLVEKSTATELSNSDASKLRAHVESRRIVDVQDEQSLDDFLDRLSSGSL